MNKSGEKRLTLNPLHRRVPPQAVLDFHQQVSSVVALISEQYTELLREEDSLSKICSQEQVKSQLMRALIASGRYFTLKEQMEVRTTSITDGILKHIFFCFPHVGDFLKSVLLSCSPPLWGSYVMWCSAKNHLVTRRSWGLLLTSSMFAWWIRHTWLSTR